MKNFLLLFLLLIFSELSFAQDYIFFFDSPDTSYYDPSWGYYNGASYLELKGPTNNKYPVSVTNFYSGINSLKLHWISESGGDWGMAVAAEGWPGFNILLKDSLTFMVYSAARIDSSSLPVIYIQDLNNNTTPKVKLSNFVDSISANTWQKIIVPLSVFKNNPGSADLTKIKTVFFGQNLADGAEHTIYIDEVRMINAGNSNTNSPSTPTGVQAKGYDSHIDVLWNPNPETNIMGYYIYRMLDTASTYVRIGVTTPDVPIYTDFVGSPGIKAKYEVTAFDSNNIESLRSSTVTATTYSMSDDQLLTMLQEATFRYFWNYAHPVSGLARERLGSGETVTTGGSGFGVMAILVGVNRGFITRDQGAQRMIKILNFLSTKADRFHGAFPHWMNGTTGKVIPFSTYDDGGDLVETADMIQGLLTARQFFNQNTVDEDSIRSMITNIWQTVDWAWYERDNTSYTLYWHWSPDFGWMMNMPIRGYNEAMIVYLLAIASQTHGVSKYCYDIGWSGYLYANGKSFYGYPLYVGQDYGGPLFFAHYSFLGFDPRNKKDKFADYFINNRNQTLINRAYCIANPNHFAGYDSVTWGLTASDGPSGYDAHSPTNDDGTISPTAAISSMPYTPTESIAAFKNLYHKYGKWIWGPFGFKDAFNVSKNWYAGSYVSIDEGPIIDMVENYRSQLLWNNFMANPEIQPMLDNIGFVPDFTDVKKTPALPKEFVLEGNYPNPFNPGTTIKFLLPESGYVEINIYNILGEKIRSLANNIFPAGEEKVQWNGKNDFGEYVSSGVYIYTLKAMGKELSRKMLLLK